VYDYVDGKADWMAYGLPVEGEDGPFLGSHLTDPPSCDVDLTVGEVRPLVARAEPQPVVVLADGLAVGEVDGEALAGHGDDVAVLDVMDPVPSTVRPSVTLAAVAGAGGGRRLVTTSDGRLLGHAEVEAGPDDDGGPGHDHAGEEAFERELGEVMAAIAERFGDREPSEEELRSFLHDRLVSEGKSSEEADRFLDQLGADEE
jgi:hypothetical protein